jgi:hypothetical protein
MPGVGQHAGMAASQKLKGWVNIQEYILQTLPNGWVNMQELAAKPQKTIGLGVGQHAGIVGQHEQEWWVNMDRNLQPDFKINPVNVCCRSCADQITSTYWVIIYSNIHSIH